MRPRVLASAAKTVNGEPGTGIWERVTLVYGGNSPENSKWRTKDKKKKKRKMRNIWENVRKCYG